MNLGIGGHQSAAAVTDEWITPREILSALGEFDLDPCASVTQPWPTAKRMFTVDDNGLAQNWSGRVWLNPPYGQDTGRWLKRLANHENGIALIFARTETEHWFDYVWNKAHAILFLKGRLTFHYPDGSKAPANSGAPSALIAYGSLNALELEVSNIKGSIVNGWHVTQPP